MHRLLRLGFILLGCFMAIGAAIEFVNAIIPSPPSVIGLLITMGALVFSVSFIYKGIAS